MSEGPSAGKRPSRFRPSARLLGWAIVGLAWICILAPRHLGWFQSLEFQVYDAFLRRAPRAAGTDPIVLVELTESDIQHPAFDYPIHDDKLAELLQILAAQKPAVIGLDFWRDVPVPKSGTGREKLDQVLLAHTNVVAIFTLGGIAPPAALGFDSERIAFNDNFPVDVHVDATIPKVRRSLLFADTESGESFQALPFSLAVRYLEQRGIHPAFQPGEPPALLLGKARLHPFQPNDGAYVRADARGWGMLLDFRCPDDFTRFSMMQVLSGGLPPGLLRDKIILVGPNAASVSDERVTPIRRDHKGVEVQALTVHQLLRHAIEGGSPLRTWSDRLEDGWILLWCALGGLIGFRARSPRRFVPSLLAGGLSIPGIAWFAFAQGWWIPVVTPAAGFLAAMAFVVAHESFQERTMRSVLMKLYSRHVSKEIAESVWANRDSFLDGGRPLAQKLVVTVLFTDLKGFSTIAERMEAARLYGWLNGYLGAMAQVIQEHGGVLKQFTGDGILALFGVPVPRTTRAQQSADAAAAVRCALAMGQRLVGLSQLWQQEGLPSVSMRAGIYTGEVAAGSVGSDDRFEYAVVGDVVNTAARLESYDKTLADPDALSNRCRILIGAPTHALLDGAFEAREIGLLQVKGKVEKVAVFLVLGESAGASGVDNGRQVAPAVSSSGHVQPFS